MKIKLIMNERIIIFIFFILIAVGVVLTFFGLTHIDWVKSFPFSSDEAIYKYFSVILFCALYIFLGVKLTKFSVTQHGVMLFVLLALATGTLWSMFVTIWFFCASIIFGKGILSFFRIKDIENNWVISFLVGAGAYGSIVGLIAHYPVNYPGVYGLVLAIPIFFWWRSFLGMYADICRWFDNKDIEKKRVNWLELSIVTVAFVHFVITLMPEVSHDALAMHLFIPAQLSLNHQWDFDFGTYVWAVMPKLADWIFSIGYMLGGETTSRLINLGFIFILCRLIRDLVIWGGGNKTGSLWAILIFISTPLTFTESSTLFVESVWASFVIGGTIAVLNICTLKNKQKSYFPIAGLLLGFSLASKVITVTVLPVLLLVLIVKYKLWLKVEARNALLLGLSLFLLTACIPYVTSWVLTDSPIFPFFNNYFKSPHYFLEAFNNSLYNSGLSWGMLYQIVFSSGDYLESGPGAGGYHWLILLIPVIFLLLIKRHVRGLVIITIAALAVTIVFQFQSYLRYIFPSYILFTVVLGIFFSMIYDKPIPFNRIIYLLGGVAVCLNLFFANAGTQYKDFPLQSIFSETDRNIYLETALPIRNAVSLINELNKSNTPVAVFSYPLAAGLKADALYPNWYNHNFKALVDAVNTEQESAEMLHKKNIEYIVLDQSWGDSEKRLLIKNSTEEILSFGKGAISVRGIRNKYKRLFSTESELLKNTDFSTSTGWGLSNGVIITPENELIVSATSLASQIVPITPGNRYVKTILAQCHTQPTQGRLQINWIDDDSKLISVDIRVFDCTNEVNEESMKVVAPPKSAHAVIYAGGHTDIPIAYKEVHFNHD